MHRLVVYLGYFVYLLVFLGFVFHTSMEPVVFGKYSLRLTGLLLTLLLLFVPFRFFLLALSKKSTISLADGRQLEWRPAQKILLVTVVLLLCLAPFEIILRATSDSLFVQTFHPFLQIGLVPGDSNLHVNSHGFRGDEISTKKPDDVYRVFLVGGSTVLSEGVPFDKSHARILERLLQERYTDKRIEVLNAGNNWHTSEHTLIKYLFKIADYEPDLIIVWHAINDYYRSFSTNDLSQGNFRSDYSHYLGPVSRMVHEHDNRAIVRFNVRSVQVIANYLNTLMYTDFRNPGPHPVDVRVQELPSLVTFRRNMSRLVDIVRRDGVDLVLATQPYLYREGLTEEELHSLWVPTKLMVVGETYPSLGSVIQAMHSFNNETRELAMAKGAHLIDLERKIPKTGEYFRDDCHYTEKGNALVANVLFNFIVERNVVR